MPERQEEQPRRAERHHLAPGVHRQLARLGGGERGLQARRQPAHILLLAHVELADVDAGEALRGPEGLAVDGDAPGVPVLDREVSEEHDARPEGNRTEELGAGFGGGPRDEVAREQEPGERRAGEQRGREADVIEPAIGEGLVAVGRGHPDGDQQADGGERHHDALRAGFGADGEESGGSETERRGDRPEHDAGPTPRRDDEDEPREEHHGAFTGGEVILRGHENWGASWHVGQGTRG